MCHWWWALGRRNCGGLTGAPGDQRVDLRALDPVTAVADVVHEDDTAGRVADEGNLRLGAGVVVLDGVGLEGVHAAGNRAWLQLGGVGGGKDLV